MNSLFYNKSCLDCLCLMYPILGYMFHEWLKEIATQTVLIFNSIDLMSKKLAEKITRKCNTLKRKL